jgi:ABC-2 type transport system permease protein
MREMLRSFFVVVRREAAMVARDPDIRMIALVAPIFYSLFYGTLYLNKGEHDVRVVVADLDRTPTSETLIRHLDANQYIQVAGVTSDEGEARQALERFDAEGVIVIPNRCEAGLKAGKGADLTAYLNTTRFLVSNDINKGVNEVVLAFNTNMRREYFESQAYSRSQAQELGEPVVADIRPLFNTNETYGDFLIPGILVIILQQAAFMAMGESVAKEREEGTLKALCEASGGKAALAFAGKGTMYFCLFGSYALLFFTVHFGLFSIPVRGDAGSLVLLTILFLLAVVAMGMLIATFFRRKIVALQVLAFTSYPIFLISGYSWPMQVLPMPLRALAQVFPITPFLAGFTRIIEMGAGIGDVLPEVIHLCILIGAGAAIAMWRLRQPTLLGQEAKRKWIGLLSQILRGLMRPRG